MKLTIRTLSQKIIHVEMDHTQSVMELKEHLVTMPEIAIEADSMQLIYSGRILEDNEPLGSYSIDEDKFIVVMGKKKVTVSSHPEPEPKPVATTTDSVTAPPDDKTNTNTTTQPPMPTNRPDERHVRDLMNMGYPEEVVRAALVASFGHPERAIEYLVNGIPDNSSDNTVESVPPTAQTTASDQSLRDNYSILSQDPRFTQIRDMLRQNPELLAGMLDHLSLTDPHSAQIMRDNQDEFFTLINRDNDTLNNSEMAFDVELTAQEAEAVERLTALGFSRESVIPVYLACDKNEELTADILFRESEEEHD